MIGLENSEDRSFKTKTVEFNSGIERSRNVDSGLESYISANIRYVFIEEICRESVSGSRPQSYGTIV